MGVMRSAELPPQERASRSARRRLDRVIIAVLAVVVAILVFDNYLPFETGQGIEPPSIVVLPFRNQSGDSSDEYFADGLAEELLSALARVPELKVASRTASFYYKDKDVDSATIAATLRVDAVLSGSVRRSGGRIRVTASLDDPTAGRLLWNETYDDRTVNDLLDIQSSIAAAVARAVVPVLSPESAGLIEARPTQNADAYVDYLQGRNYLRQPDEEALVSAVERFDRAIALDPSFAHAYAGLCEAQLGRFEETRDPGFFGQAEIACQRALTLDSRLWETRVALGNLYRINGQYDRAIDELEIAVAGEPRVVSPYLALALAYENIGAPDRAEATLRRAEEIEPGDWDVHRVLGNFLYRASRFDEAVEHYTRVTELAPDSDIGYNNLGNLYLALGRLDEAETALNATPRHTRFTYTNRGLVYYYRGEFEKAVEDQRRAIQIAPEYFANWGRLGDAYRFIEGEAQNAREAYVTAIDLAGRDLLVNPTNWENLGRLGTYYAATERPAEARARIAEMLELTSDGNAYYYAMLVSARIGDDDLVADYLQKSIEGGWSPALLARDPDLAELRDDPGIAALLPRVPSAAAR